MPRGAGDTKIDVARASSAAVSASAQPAASPKQEQSSNINDDFSSGFDHPPRWRDYRETDCSSITSREWRQVFRSILRQPVFRRVRSPVDQQLLDQRRSYFSQRPVGASVELTIDQGKYFAAILDDVIEKQSDINNLSIWADDASEQMKIVVDSDVLLFLLGQAATGNAGLTAGVISGNINLGVTGTPVNTVGRNPTTGQVEIIDIILRIGQCLDEQNIPETGRWIVMPTWATFQLKRSELREVFVSGDQVSILRNGKFGQVDRFTIYASNLLPKGVITGPPALAAGEYVIYGGHAHGLTFASQMTNVETIRSERTFGQILRGLQVYGRAVLDPKAICQAIVTQVAGT